MNDDIRQCILVYSFNNNGTTGKGSIEASLDCELSFSVYKEWCEKIAKSGGYNTIIIENIIWMEKREIFTE